MRYPVYHYRTPDGYSDFPFTYIFDASGLADGVNLSQVSQKLQGDSDFLLRQVMGLDTVVDTPANGGKVQLYNASGTFISNVPVLPPPTLPILPEKLYRFSEVIRFDLYQTLRRFIISSPPPNKIYLSFIGFRGVKRFTGTGFNIETAYEYREVPQIYVTSVTVDWTYFSGPSFTAVAAPRRFVVPIQNWDFELDRVLVSIVAPTGTAAPVTTDFFSVQLHDSQGHMTSDLPVPVTMLSSAGGPPGALPRYRPVFPVPPLVYPAGTQIVFDITSLLSASSSPVQTYQFAFQGVWRIPCAAGNLPAGGEL